jgi:hypothetical protein
MEDNEWVAVGRVRWGGRGGGLPPPSSVPPASSVPTASTVPRPGGQAVRSSKPPSTTSASPPRIRPAPSAQPPQPQPQPQPQQRRPVVAPPHGGLGAILSPKRSPTARPATAAAPSPHAHARPQAFGGGGVKSGPTVTPPTAGQQHASSSSSSGASTISFRSPPSSGGGPLVVSSSSPSPGHGGTVGPTSIHRPRRFLVHAEMCGDWLWGGGRGGKGLSACPLGDTCPFAHGERELRLVSLEERKKKCA